MCSERVCAACDNDCECDGSSDHGLRALNERTLRVGDVVALVSL